MACSSTGQRDLCPTSLRIIPCRKAQRRGCKHSVCKTANVMQPFSMTNGDWRSVMTTPRMVKADQSYLWFGMIWRYICITLDATLSCNWPGLHPKDFPSICVSRLQSQAMTSHSLWNKALWIQTRSRLVEFQNFLYVPLRPWCLAWRILSGRRTRNSSDLRFLQHRSPLVLMSEDVALIVGFIVRFHSIDWYTVVRRP